MTEGFNLIEAYRMTVHVENIDWRLRDIIVRKKDLEKSLNPRFIKLHPSTRTKFESQLLDLIEQENELAHDRDAYVSDVKTINRKISEPVEITRKPYSKVIKLKREESVPQNTYRVPKKLRRVGPKSYRKPPKRAYLNYQRNSIKSQQERLNSELKTLIESIKQYDDMPMDADLRQSLQLLQQLEYKKEVLLIRLYMKNLTIRANFRQLSYQREIDDRVSEISEVIPNARLFVQKNFLDNHFIKRK